VRVYYPYGSKKRLFEMVQKVNGINLTEEILTKEKRFEIFNELIEFIKKKLNLTDDDIPEITISHDSNEAKEMKSFGKNTPEINKIRVVDKNRNLADTCRTIVHEIVHTKQYKTKKLDSNSGNDGSEFENEANALAGVIMREFGKLHPEIFE
jgi:hypothetical protein